MSQPKVLVVLSSHNKLGDTGKPTGWYLVTPPDSILHHDSQPSTLNKN